MAWRRAAGDAVRQYRRRPGHRARPDGCGRAGRGDHRPAPRCQQRRGLPGACGGRGRGQPRAAGAEGDHRPQGCGGVPHRDGLSGDVGRLEPDAPPDLPHERPPRWSEDLAAFVPMEGEVPGLVRQARRTAPCRPMARWPRPGGGRGGAGDMGIKAAEVALPRPRMRPMRCAPFGRLEGKGRAWLDFANDVTTKDVKLAAQENYRSVEHMKRYTTQGMAPDQGKNSNVARWRCWPMPRGAASPRRERRPSARPSCRCRSRRWARAGRGAGLRRSGSDQRPGQPRPRRADDRGGAVVPAQLFPQAGREDLGSRPATAKSRWCCGAVGVAMSRPWARSTCRAGCGAVPGFPLHQHVQHPGRWPCPLWPDAARGRDGAG